MITNNMGSQKTAAPKTQTAEAVKTPEEKTITEETKTQTAESGETSGDDNAELPEI